MITAREALKLPFAQLRPSDSEAVEVLLKEIEEHILVNMDRGGCRVPVDPSRVNGAIAAEIELQCRLSGWKAEFIQVKVPSRLVPGEHSLEFFLSLQPKEEAYVDVEDITSSTKAAFCP